MKRRFSTLLLSGCLLLASCLPEVKPEDFTPPTLGEIAVTPGVFEANASCEISSSSGFTSAELLLYSGGGSGQKELQCVSAELTGGKTLVATLSNLQSATEYSCRFRISNGEYERFSAFVSFKTTDGPEYITFEDKSFERYILGEYDLDSDGRISKAEARKIKSIDVGADSIASLRGIEYMPNLTYLYARGINEKDIKTSKLYSLDLKGNPNLTVLHCINNHISSLDLSCCPNLEELFCWNNKLTELDVSGLKYLLDLRCAQSDFAESGLDLSANTRLRKLYVNDTQISELDISNNPELVELDCGDNYLSELNISHLNNLTILSCSNNNSIRELVINHPEKLTRYSIGDTHITDFEIIKKMPLLEDYGGNNVQIYKMPDFSENPRLTSIHICGTGGALYLPDSTDFFTQWPALKALNVCCFQGTHIDFSKNTNLESLWISDCPNLEELDLSASSKFQYISFFHDTNLKTIYIHPDLDPKDIEISGNDGSCPAVFVKK